jgi:hypothetical protein
VVSPFTPRSGNFAKVIGSRASAIPAAEALAKVLFVYPERQTQDSALLSAQYTWAPFGRCRAHVSWILEYRPHDHARVGQAVDGDPQVGG